MYISELSLPGDETRGGDRNSTKFYKNINFQ